MFWPAPIAGYGRACFAQSYTQNGPGASFAIVFQRDSRKFLPLKAGPTREKPLAPESSIQSRAGSERPRDTGSICGSGSALSRPYPRQPRLPPSPARGKRAGDVHRESRPEACLPPALRARGVCRAGANVAASEKGEGGEAPPFYCRWSEPTSLPTPSREATPHTGRATRRAR